MGVRPCVETHLVGAGSVEAQGEAVEENYDDANPFEPRGSRSR